MSWTDLNSIKTIKFLRNKYKISTFLETGSFCGINAKTQSKNFKNVVTCEKIEKYYKIASEKCKDYKNVFLFHSNSSLFLETFDFDKIPMIYCDAHFYDKNLPKGKGKFVILKELEAIQNNWNLRKDKIIIIIHDFKYCLGGISYDGLDLNMELVRKDLLKINSKFNFYTNTIEGCAPLKEYEVKDEDAKDNIRYMWSKPRLTYRGVLYCLPTKLTDKEMKKLNLVNIK